MSVAFAIRAEAEAAKALLANIRDVIADDDEMAMTAIEGETSFLEIVDDALDRIIELETFMEALETRIKDASERRSRFEEQRDRIKAALLVAMGQIEQRKIERPVGTISIRAVAPKVEVTEEADIPAEFWKPQDPKLDKKSLLEALKAKRAVPGATLSNGGETLAFKRS
ncbi:MAG: siphovirus Gp157 family protein [Betaproteobacteria bacterium]